MSSHFRRLSMMVLICLISTNLLAAGRKPATEAFKGSNGDGAAIQPLALGDATQDLLYTTLAQPCRILDTRIAGGPIAPGQTRNFYAIEAEDGDIASQGGSAGGCFVPPGAAAIMVNFVAVTPAGPGNLKSTAFGFPMPPVGSIINYAAVPNLNIANAVAQPICGAGSEEQACFAEFSVQANGAAVHLVADVLGFFMEHQTAFTHTASLAAGNISGNQTTINHPVTNGNPSAILLITQNTSLDPNPAGVRYDAASQRWAIYHPNGAAMPNGAMFNVLILNP